jgi:hypothetical protein
MRGLDRIVIATLAAACLGGSPGAFAKQGAAAGRYDDLLRLFAEWRAFQGPKLVAGVPDYTAAAMQAQRRRLPEFERRLAAIDDRSWPVAQRIDHHLLRAEMNGLDFDHRVLRPWSRDPCFYTVIHPDESDVPRREGPVLPGAIEAWRLSFPLAEQPLGELTAQLEAVPAILAQARANLVEDARDLWLLGIRARRNESAALGELGRRLAPHHPQLLPDVDAARRAVDAFRAWLEQGLPEKRGPSGVGKEDYDWYLKHVHLSPFTWQGELALAERELGRALAQLALEAHRNRALPALEPAASAEEYRHSFDAAVTEYIRFLRDGQILTVTDDMEPALRARGGSFQPPGDRDFFAQVDHREPLLLRCHGFHWFDRARMERAPHPSPIRSAPLLYNIWDSRAEGLATAMEEMMMSAGLLEGRPRSRELVYVLVANRAARALAGLRMHSNELTVEQAVRFAHEWTPYGWLKADGDTAWFEQQLYLEQPGYGTCYLAGKAQIEELLGERRRQLGEGFALRPFIDELQASGMIPVSMIRWEMTGREDPRFR